jgi:hypothetical protein
MIDKRETIQNGIVQTEEQPLREVSPDRVTSGGAEEGTTAQPTSIETRSLPRTTQGRPQSAPDGFDGQSISSDSGEEVDGVEKNQMLLGEMKVSEPKRCGGNEKIRMEKQTANTLGGKAASKGKEVADEDVHCNGRADERVKQKLIKQLRRELKAAEEGSGGDAGRCDWGEEGDAVGTRSKEALQIRKRRRQMPRELIPLERRDPLGPQWAAVRDVPPLEVNRLGEPTGAFWDHMQPYVFDRGASTFPWHVNWNQQDPELKARFLLRLRELYPGPWEAKAMLIHLGNNLRERRNRLKKRFKIFSNPRAVTRPKGCTMESWDQIFKDLKDPKKKEKSELCKLKAEERIANGGSPFTHRTGRGGYRGIVAKFVSCHSLDFSIRSP